MICVRCHRPTDYLLALAPGDSVPACSRYPDCKPHEGADEGIRLAMGVNVVTQSSAPSCDSPELAAHRNGIGGSVKSGAEWIPTAVGVALLRMVDEITKQRDDYWHQYITLEGENVDRLANARLREAYIEDLLKEIRGLQHERDDARALAQTLLATRDELRAKLVEAEREGEVMKVIINGASVEVDAGVITYDMIQRIAFNGKAVGEHTVRFHGGLDGRTGTLCPGEAVEIVDGTVFNVFATDGPPA